MFENEDQLLSRINAGASLGRAFAVENATPAPDHLTIQWHITDRCNLKCTHCYIHDRPLPDLDLDKLESMLQNYVRTLKLMKIKGRIHVTGGEPFMRRDFFDFLEKIYSYKEYCSFGVMCNGTMISGDNAARLKELGAYFVQVSLDGGMAGHDAIRGKGNFRKSLDGIKILRRHGIPISVSFTAGKNNRMEFADAANAARKAGAASVWTDRVIPERGNCETANLLMDDDEMIEYLTLVNRTRKKFSRRLFRKTGISMGRALQFMYYDGQGFEEYPYRCNAGHTVLTVLADGRVVPCRRMPVIIGDLKTESLHDIYHNSKLLGMLRESGNIPGGCGECRYSMVCNGGLKCLSYAVHANPFMRDPQCSDFLLEKRINKL